MRDFLADHLVDMSRGFGWPERGRSARKRVFVDQVPFVLGSWEDRGAY